jgi:putative transposase
MELIRTYKYRLYPSKPQSKFLDVILEQHRYAYNRALGLRIMAYKEFRISLSAFDECKLLKEMRRKKTPLIPAHSFQNTLKRLDKSYKSFFRRVKSGQEKAGFPRFKSYHRFKSFVFVYDIGAKIVNTGIKYKLKINNIGLINIKWHRDFPENAELKCLIIKRSSSGKWYVCVQFKFEKDIPKRETSEIGIDVGLSHLVATSDGEFFDSPKYYKESQKKLRVSQRSVAKRKKGSNRRRKSVKILVTQHEHIANQRLDFAHKISRQLVNDYSHIALEKVSLKFMTKNKYLAKTTHDVAIGKFRELLCYKAEEAGSMVVFVNPKNTSQMCSNCGCIVKKGLSVREHRCPHCGFVEDRDVNAAINIKNLAFG